MARQVYTDWRKEAVPPEVEELRGYLNQLPLPWREKMLPFLGRGVSAGLHYAGGDAAKVEALSS